MPMRAEDPPAQAPEQRVVDRDEDRRARLGQALGNQGSDPQAELIGRPARAAEEAVRSAVIPDPASRAAGPSGRERPYRLALARR